MQYFYQDAKNTEQGPLDENELLKLAAAGTIRRDTQIRTTLLKNCRDAEKFAFLARFFAENNDSGESTENAAPSSGSFNDRFNAKEQQSSAFVQHNRPKSAALTSRIGALVLDLLVFAILALVIFLPIQYMTRTVELTEVEEVEEEEEMEEIQPPATTTPATDTIAVKPQAPAASSEDNGIFANVNRASGGGSNIYSQVKNKALNVRDINDKRNKELNRAINDGKESKEKKTSKSKKPKTPPKPSPSDPATMPKEAPPVAAADTPPPEPPKIEERLESALKATKKKFNQFSIYPIEYSDSAIVVSVSNHETHTYDRAKLEPLLHTGFWIWMVAVFFYYSLTLGYYAQTFGMWYCGIFIARNNIKEVYYLRAMLYSVALVLLGVLMIPLVLFTRRSAAEWLSGVRVIHVYGAKN